jgi:hypothetical protein
VGPEDVFIGPRIVITLGEAEALVFDAKIVHAAGHNNRCVIACGRRFVGPAAVDCAVVRAPRGSLALSGRGFLVERSLAPDFRPYCPCPKLDELDLGLVRGALVR